MILLGLVLTTFLGFEAHATAADEPRFVDYLYMEPNEGGASAGHVALAFEDRTYAFQRSPEGRLILERDATAHVRYLYAVLGNRAVERSRIAVSPATFERLREGFNRRYLVQQRQLALQGRLAEQRRVLDLLRARARGAGADGGDGLALEAAGYFQSAPTGGAESPALRVLRAEVARSYGRAFVERRIAELRVRLSATAPESAATPPPVLSVDEYPADADLFVNRYAALAIGIAALETLQAATALDPDGLIAVDEALDEAGAAALGRHAERLRGDLVRLAASEREDFGASLLIGMARLAAIERSRAEHRLVVLDAFPPHGRRLPREALARAPAAARGLLDDARAELAASLRSLTAASEPSERDYVGVESAANRVGELARGVAGGHDVRLAPETMLPTRSRLLRRLVLPEMPAAQLTAAADAAARAADAHARAFDELYRYDLLRRNCVTEMLRTVDAVLGPDAAEALGGRVDADGGWRFIPKVATRAIRRSWQVVASDTIPSYRQATVAALARTGNPAVVRLRESNTLTSTVYRRSRDDSTFLFFTDDVVLLRPLLGAANLAVGAGASLIGVALVPFDRGESLAAGLRGMLWSVPELAFVNVRKGSFDYVPRELGNAPLEPLGAALLVGRKEVR